MKAFGKAAQVLCIGSMFVGLLLAVVRTDYDHSAMIQKYHTYSWITVQSEDDLWNPRIRRDVDSELTARGWKEVQQHPEVSISAYGSTLNETSLRNWYQGFGGDWQWERFDMNRSGSKAMKTTPVGTLNIDIFDTLSKKLIWRGTSIGALSSDVRKDEKKLKKDLADMFGQFPPTS